MIDREKQALERAKIIEEIVPLSKEHKHLVVELPTGTGKGNIVAECIAASDGKKKWVVLVPEIAQIANYIENLKKFNNEDLLGDRIEEILCYASIDKLAGRSVNLHLNECHHVSHYRMDVLRSVDYNQILSDSATIDEDVSRKLANIHPFFRYKKTMQECIELGILPQPEIICVGIEMNEKQDRGYDNLNNSVEFWKKEWEQESKQWMYNKWMQAGMKRKRWMCEQKTKMADVLLSEWWRYRYVCYCGSVKQAKELGGTGAIHSGNKKNKLIIREFNNELTNSLYTCQMVIEGMNFNNIERGLIIQLDGITRTFIQKLGRILRGDNPIIYLLYIKRSKDETYLKNALWDLNKNHVRYV